MKARSGSLIACLALICLANNTSGDDGPARALALLDECNVRWTSPSDDAWGSMPLGNGDVGMNFWVEPNGDYVFYISKSDAWSEGSALLKVGRVRVRFEPNLLCAGGPFVQQLKLREGEITVQAGIPGESISVRVWIDAHRPVIMFESDAEAPVTMRAEVEIWRKHSRELTDIEAHMTLRGTPIVDADLIVDSEEEEILWCHRNEVSFWDYGASAAKHPELGLPELQDPHLHRTFGGLLSGENMVKTGPTAMASAKPAKVNRFSICVYTAQTDALEHWTAAIRKLSEDARSSGLSERRQAHRQWWQNFWTRSWVFVDGDEDAARVSQGYNLQRFMNACAGRGEQPILFNGSLFTLPVLKEFPEYN
ncbi:MAG TPA: DUF5703 domain-containing protein, partial [Lacipirellulaceae bacterium]|nr:DUF5703 domain-containing protein [Lacipirellulaceae bacterium]